MSKENKEPQKQPCDMHGVVLSGNKASRKPWNYGKRKPITDEFGQNWCNCEIPKLTTGIGIGIAFCVKCCTPYYH